MPVSYRVTVTKILPPEDAAAAITATEAATSSAHQRVDVYTQTLDDLNLPAFIRALNPLSRKRRGKKEAQNA